MHNTLPIKDENSFSFTSSDYNSNTYRSSYEISRLLKPLKSTAPVEIESDSIEKYSEESLKLIWLNNEEDEAWSSL